MHRKADESFLIVEISCYTLLLYLVKKNDTEKKQSLAIYQNNLSISSK